MATTRRLLLVAIAALGTAAQWTPDRGDGSYRNPVLHADYSDPDVVRVGDDYYLTASSFSCAPGLPILHSRDLVNWTLVGHAMQRQVPEDVYATPQHGKGCWAPAFRHHDGKFWIFYPDPDFGIYAVTAKDPAGEWSAPTLVKAGKGLIDPCPFWDDDGRGFLVHAWAKSRSGINNILTLQRLGRDGLRVEGEARTVVDGNALPGYTTLEGPKLYKRAGYYYIFAPAGGVQRGWQSVFRSPNVEGPYEPRIVMRQGGSAINGPHQGAWVDTGRGENWFLHFQDKEAYGRVVHLQPLSWGADGWPVIGADPDGDGIGEPVLFGHKPKLAGPAAPGAPQTSDEFDAPRLGLQWQWQANPQSDWLSLGAKPGALRLYARPAESLWLAPHLLLQKFPAPEFVVTTSLSFAPAAEGEVAGLVVFGHDYAWLGLRRTAAGVRVSLRVCRDARNGTAEQEQAGADLASAPVLLRVQVAAGGRCHFSYGTGAGRFHDVGEIFTARPGHWVGAKVGLFARSAPGAGASGHVDVDWFRVTER